MRAITASFLVTPFVIAQSVLFAAWLDARAAEVPDRQRVSLDAGWRFQQVDDPDLVDIVVLDSWRWRVDPMSDVQALAAASVKDTSGVEWKTAATALVCIVCVRNDNDWQGLASSVAIVSRLCCK